jgi:hypothetical protein
MLKDLNVPAEHKDEIKELIKKKKLICFKGF